MGALGRIGEKLLWLRTRRTGAALIASSIAHDANNVLCALVGELELGSSDYDRRRVQLCIDRLAALNEELLKLSARASRPEPGAIDLARTVDDGLATFRHDPRLRRCTVMRRGSGELQVAADAALVHRIVANLLINAAEATGGRGSIEVETELSGADAVLAVHDDGPGVSPTRRDGLFRALESTKHSRRGLGLYSVEACVRAIGGRVEVGDSPLGGAVFRVRIPLAAHPSRSRVTSGGNPKWIGSTPGR